MLSVALAVFPGVQALDVAGPLDVFAEANGFLAADRHYVLTIVAAEPGPFRASNGLSLTPDRVVGAPGDTYDLILVAGGPALPTTAPDPRLTRWLIEATPRARRYGSVCTGAFVLGHAGLLDGHAVTTHWQDARRLAELFPAAAVDHDRIYLRDGALVTSAGVTAGIDLTLALVAEDHGAALALKVAKRLVVAAQRQGGQSQFSPYLAAPPDETSPVAKVQAHVMAHIAEKHTVASLARVAGMSVRNFARVFTQAAEMTPADFVEAARVDGARNLLEGSDLAIKAVAYRAGFGSDDRMRTVFLRRLGITPTQYRASFRRPD